MKQFIYIKNRLKIIKLTQYDFEKSVFIGFLILE
jgi:hypothetical protein